MPRRKAPVSGLSDGAEEGTPRKAQLALNYLPEKAFQTWLPPQLSAASPLIRSHWTSDPKSRAGKAKAGPEHRDDPGVGTAPESRGARRPAGKNCRL